MEALSILKGTKSIFEQRLPAALSWQTTHLMQGTLSTLPSFTMKKTCGNFLECREYIRNKQVLIYCKISYLNGRVGTKVLVHGTSLTVSYT